MALLHLTLMCMTRYHGIWFSRLYGVLDELLRPQIFIFAFLLYYMFFQQQLLVRQVSVHDKTTLHEYERIPLKGVRLTNTQKANVHWPVFLSDVQRFHLKIGSIVFSLQSVAFHI